MAKIEYKGNDRIERVQECKVLQSQLIVTKAYNERKTKPLDVESFFGVGCGQEEIKNNLGLTVIQRDNVWHPYYEVKLDEDDLGTRMRKTIESKRDKTALDG